MLTEPYSETDSRGELRRDTGGFLREIRRGTRDALREKSVDSHGRDRQRESLQSHSPRDGPRAPGSVELEVTLFSLNTSLQPLGTQRPLCLRGPPQAGLTGWSPLSPPLPEEPSRTLYGSDTTWHLRTRSRHGEHEMRAAALYPAHRFIVVTHNQCP